MADFTPDRIALPHLDGLLGVLEAELEARGLDDLCETFLGAGAEVAFEYCDSSCSGQGWARTASVFASSNFPIPDISPNRGALLMAEVFEVGIVRGMAIPSDPDEPIDRDELRSAAEKQHADMSAILASLCGYFRAKSIPFIVGAYSPYGPAGACVGGSWQVTVQTGAAPKPKV